MSVREVLLYPDPRLKQVSKALEFADFDDELVDLADDLRETMVACKGAGLAASQIGVMQRVIAIRGDNDDRDVPPLILVNPVIIHLSKNRKLMREGCLSFPGVFEMVMRSLKVKVKFRNPYSLGFTATFKGLQAHAIQHEVEHLDGILLNDHQK